MSVLAGLLGDGDEMLVVFVVVRSHKSPLPAQLRFPQKKRGRSSLNQAPHNTSGEPQEEAQLRSD
jgi:hypothetical protein